MTTAVSPEQVIGFVRELSADVRAVAVLDPAGARLAGDPMLAAAAGALVAALGASPAPLAGPAGPPDGAAPDELVVRTPDGVLFLARTPAHVVVAVAGPLTLIGPTALDLRTAVTGLGTGPQVAVTTPPPAASRLPEPALGLAIGAVRAVS